MRHVCFLACWSLFLLDPAPASADKPAERAEAARRFRAADHAVVGTIDAIESRIERNQFGDVLIVSRVSVNVTEQLRGQSAWSRVSFDAEGGTYAGYTLKVSDMPELKKGHRGVFLLRKRAGRDVMDLSERGASLVPLSADDSIPGSELTLEDLRGVARQVGR